MHATYIRPRHLPKLQNSTASQKQHSLQDFCSFGCYLLPLAVLELYLRAKEALVPAGGSPWRAVSLCSRPLCA